MGMGDKDDDDEDEETMSKAGVPSTFEPYTHPDSHDFALALPLQQQEERSSAFTLESSSESESESESENEVRDIFSNYQEFLDSQGRLEFLEEEEDSNSDQDMEEDDIDPDELSYEELIALGEIVGEESKGLSADEISSSLHPSVFHFPPSTTSTTTSTTTTTLVDRCVICQVEYEEGETMVGLIPCDHPYHLDCITTWLQIRKICPICSSEVSSTESKLPLNSITD